MYVALHSIMKHWIAHRDENGSINWARLACRLLLQKTMTPDSKNVITYRKWANGGPTAAVRLWTLYNLRRMLMW